MAAWVEANDFQHMTLFCQDWGSLVGLRMVAELPSHFDRIVLANGGLPTGTTPTPKAFKIWRAFAVFSPWFPIGLIVKTGCAAGLTPQEIAAYDAPFPTRKYKIAARLFPTFVPTSPQDPERANNERAWELFKRWDKPFLTLFSTRDPITRWPKSLAKTGARCPRPTPHSHPWRRAFSARRQGCGGGQCGCRLHTQHAYDSNGLRIFTPNRSKSLTLRVTTVSW
jgi:pimeloyl-ACP methyl ester carboxylesterase